MVDTRKENVYELKKNTAKLFNSECFICHLPFGKGFAFHHRDYTKGEKTYRDFPNPLDYQEYIVVMVRKKPNQYFLLCHPHHYLVEKLKRFKDKKKLERLFHVVLNSV